MKTVFTSVSHIAHLWANQLQDEARNSGNFYFSGTTIYSYSRHFPIAKHVQNDSLESAVLFTERTYSNTTSKHIAVVRQAASHKNIIYCFNPESSERENFNSWQSQAENIAANLAKAKKPEIYLNQIAQVKERAENYAEFFSLAIPESLAAALAIANKDEYFQYNAKKIEFAAKKLEQDKKEQAKKHKKALGEWLNGKTNRLYIHNGEDFLRVRDGRIETTQAVQIPFELGKKLYNQVKENTLEVGQKVLNYEVNEVGKIIKIGCHTFKKQYLLKFGEQTFAGSHS